MESPYSQETPQPDASAALVPQECTNNKENAAPPSPVEREHDELRKTPRDDERGARDAPPLLDAAQSDDASDALRGRGAAPAKSPLPRILGKIMAQRAERGERAAARAKARGDDPGVNAYDTAVGARRYAGVGAAAYAPRVQSSKAGIATHPKDFRQWRMYETNEQIEADIERLGKIEINGESALEVGLNVVNAVGKEFFAHFPEMIDKKVTNRAGRGAALTRESTNTLANKAMRIDVHERVGEEGEHVKVFRGMKEQLEKLGAVAGNHGTVEGQLKDFATAGIYHGYDDHTTDITELGCLTRKFFIIGAYLGRLSEEVEDGVDCSFGKRTMNMNKRKGLASNKAGNFGSHAQDGVPLPPEHKDPQDLRFGQRVWLGKGPLGEETWGLIGKTGEGTLKAAATRGDQKLFIFGMGGFDVSTLKVSDVVKSSKRPIKDPVKRAASWKATLERCKVVAPVLHSVYDALFQLGMMHAPTNQKRTEYGCLQGAYQVIGRWRDGRSSLADAFVVGMGDGPNLLCSLDVFEKIQKWDADADYTRTLLDHAGVETLSELVHVTGDSSTGVLVSSGRPFSGGYRLVPRDTATEDGHGGFKHKPKKPKRGTGNGPTRFKCHRCGSAWNPELSAIHREGWSRCVCGTNAKPEA